MFFIFLEKVSFINRCSTCWQTSYSYLNPVLLYLIRSWALLIGPSLLQCWPPFDSSSLRSVLFTRWVGGTSIVTTFNFFSLLRKHLSRTPTLCWWLRRPVFDSTRKKALSVDYIKMNLYYRTTYTQYPLICTAIFDKRKTVKESLNEYVLFWIAILWLMNLNFENTKKEIRNEIGTCIYIFKCILLHCW